MTHPNQLLYRPTREFPQASAEATSPKVCPNHLLADDCDTTSSMRNSAPTSRDDPATIVAIAVIACVVQDVLHEGLGHGVTAWLSGAHYVTLSTVAMQSDLQTRWISANGTLVNLLFAAVFWLLLRGGERYSPPLRYFFVLAMMGNLFTGTGYFLFSGVTDFGDWAAVIQGLEPHWAWRLGLVVVGAASYYLSMLLVAAELKPFHGSQAPPSRMRGLCWIPYCTDGILAGVAGLFNPVGLFYVIASALPSTLGANAGLWSLPSMMRKNTVPPEESVPMLSRSIPWIAAGTAVAALFIFVLGRGLTWSR